MQFMWVFCGLYSRILIIDIPTEMEPCPRQGNINYPVPPHPKLQILETPDSKLYEFAGLQGAGAGRHGFCKGTCASPCGHCQRRAQTDLKDV